MSSDFVFYNTKKPLGMNFVQQLWKDDDSFKKKKEEILDKYYDR